MDIKVRKNLTIPSEEITYTTSRSSGPGGQHANKTDSRVTLSWMIEESTALGPNQKSRAKSKLSQYMTEAGILKISCDSNRSQHKNKAEVQKRLVSILVAALRVPKRRKKTKPTRGSKERRLKNKKKQSQKKKDRGNKDW